MAMACPVGKLWKSCGKAVGRLYPGGVRVLPGLARVLPDEVRSSGWWGECSAELAERSSEPS